MAAVALALYVAFGAVALYYTIYLVSRAREETAGHGTREGIVCAVSATGDAGKSPCWQTSRAT